MNAIITSLNGRRSVPSRQLADPAPDHDTLLRLLAAAVRVPDHGKREPWRFVRNTGEARAALQIPICAIGGVTRGDRPHPRG